MKGLTTLITAALLVGCTTTAGLHSYRAKSGDVYNISGTFDAVASNVTVTVDGTPYKGSLSIWTNSGHFQFTHNEHIGDVDCAEHYNLFSMYVKCVVHLDNERAATLTF